MTAACPQCGKTAEDLGRSGRFKTFPPHQAGTSCPHCGTTLLHSLTSEKTSEEKLRELAKALVKTAEDLGRTRQDALDAVLLLAGGRFTTTSEVAKEVLMLLVERTTPAESVHVLLGLAASVTMTASTSNRDGFLEACKRRWDEMVEIAMRSGSKG